VVEKFFGDMRRNIEAHRVGGKRPAQVVQGPVCYRAAYVKLPFCVALMLESIIPARHGEKVGPGMACNGFQEATDKVFVGEGVVCSRPLSVRKPGRVSR
jgi:hypothetical protein